MRTGQSTSAGHGSEDSYDESDFLRILRVLRCTSGCRASGHHPAADRELARRPRLAPTATISKIEFWRDRQSTDDDDVIANNQIARNWLYDGRWGPMQGHQPQPGELVGVMVT